MAVNWEDMWVNSTDKLLEVTEENESLQRQLDIAIDYIKKVGNFKSDIVLRDIEKTRIKDKQKQKNLRLGKLDD